MQMVLNDGCVATTGLVEGIQIADSGEKGAWILGKWVEVESVDDSGKDLYWCEPISE